jgi:paraquat-inducible protein A
MSAPAVQQARLHEALLACEECDQLHHRAALEGVGQLCCSRCGAALTPTRRADFHLPLALALCGLVLLGVAHLNPVIGISVQGQDHSASLWQAAEMLYEQDAALLSVVVLVTTLISPAAELLAICWVLVPLLQGLRAPGAARVLRALRSIRPWVMVEVFMLGVLVATVKLAGMATIILGVGVWAFAALMLVLAATATALDDERLWRVLARCQAGT